MIVDWSGREVSQTEIEIAADLHPVIKGEYPYYNLRSELTFPSAERLRGISEPFKHDCEEQYIVENYRYFEKVNYSSNERNKVVRSYQKQELPQTHKACLTSVPKMMIAAVITVFTGVELGEIVVYPATTSRRRRVVSEILYPYARAADNPTRV